MKFIMLRLQLDVPAISKNLKSKSLFRTKNFLNEIYYLLLST